MSTDLVATAEELPEPASPDAELEPASEDVAPADSPALEVPLEAAGLVVADPAGAADVLEFDEELDDPQATVSTATRVVAAASCHFLFSMGVPTFAIGWLIGTERTAGRSVLRGAGFGTERTSGA